VFDLTSSRKGAIAEAEITAAVMRHGLDVLRPLSEGGRYDLVIDTGGRLLRVQCKWATLRGTVLDARIGTSRHTPRGYVRSTYSAREIDAVAVFSPDTDACYLLPIEDVQGLASLRLRLAPTRNNQIRYVRWARDYELRESLRRNWGVSFSDVPSDGEKPRLSVA
jgi:hypothetical protein